MPSDAQVKRIKQVLDHHAPEEYHLEDNRAAIAMEIAAQLWRCSLRVAGDNTPICSHHDEQIATDTGACPVSGIVLLSEHERAAKWQTTAEHARIVAELTKEVERLSAPVTDDELSPYVLLIEDGDGHRGWFVDPDQVKVLVAARLTPPPEPQPAGTHQWTGCRAGGHPAEEGSYEWVRYCSVCGMEDTCEDPLPPCPGEGVI